MDDLLKLVKTYRFTAALDQRLRLANQIFPLVEPKLRAFVFGSVKASAASDVLQVVLSAVAGSLRNFKGDTVAEFWGWCYRIARNKLNDYFRRCASDRLQPMGHDEMRRLLDETAQLSVRPPGVSHDLEYAMKLLSNAKPECHALLWAHYVQDLGYGDLAEEKGTTYDAIRMQITRCLDEARKLLG